MPSPKRLLGLDVGSSSVKAVELTREGSAFKVTGMAQAPLTSPAELKETVKEALRRGAFRTKLTCTNVSGRNVSVKHISMTSMPEEEMKKALLFEADKHIPFEVGDVFLDGQRIGQPLPGAKEMTVALAAAKRNLILERAELVAGIGLAPSIVDVDAFALGNAFELGLLAAGGVPSQRSVAIIDIGAAKTSICILRGTATFFTREINSAGADATDAIAKKLTLPPAEAERVKCAPGENESACREATALHLDDLANEIRMSLEFYESQHESAVEDLRLTGGASRLPWLAESLGKALGKPVSPWNPFEKLPAEGQGLDPQTLAAAGGAMAVALGLASRLRTL